MPVVLRMLRSAPNQTRASVSDVQNCTSGNDGLISIRDTSGICSCCSPLICPSGGLLTGVSSPLCKNISVFTPPKSPLELCASHPTRGAYHDRHERGVGCGGRGSVLRAMGLQGGSKDL